MERSGPEHANTRRLTRPQVRNAIYVDFEGRINEDPALVGVLYRKRRSGPRQWELRQFVFDSACRAVDRKAGGGCDGASSAKEASLWLIGLSDRDSRPIVSWSEHDWKIIKGLTGGAAFRYRNAIQTAKRREIAGVRGLPHNSLANYEELIGYVRPAERYEPAASIAYIRDRVGVTPGSIDRWKCLLQHNRHDLLAMRDVLHVAAGIELPGGEVRPAA